MAWAGWEKFVPSEKPPPKRHKYGAVATEIDGVKFASKKEAKRYAELKALERAGEIHGLTLQPGFPLTVERVDWRDFLPFKIGEYRADFAYCRCRLGAKCERADVVTEDVKGFKTPLYRWKKKHVEAQYGITVVEI